MQYCTSNLKAQEKSEMARIENGCLAQDHDKQAATYRQCGGEMLGNMRWALS